MSSALASLARKESRGSPTCSHCVRFGRCGRFTDRAMRAGASQHGDCHRVRDCNCRAAHAVLPGSQCELGQRCRHRCGLPTRPGRSAHKCRTQHRARVAERVAGASILASLQLSLFRQPPWAAGKSGVERLVPLRAQHPRKRRHATAQESPLKVIPAEVLAPVLLLDSLCSLTSFA